jgi:hypothetical protein
MGWPRALSRVVRDTWKCTSSCCSERRIGFENRFKKELGRVESSDASSQWCGAVRRSDRRACLVQSPVACVCPCRSAVACGCLLLSCAQIDAHKLAQSEIDRSEAGGETAQRQRQSTVDHPANSVAEYQPQGEHASFEAGASLASCSLESSRSLLRVARFDLPCRGEEASSRADASPSGRSIYKRIVAPLACSLH